MEDCTNLTQSFNLAFGTSMAAATHLAKFTRMKQSLHCLVGLPAFRLSSICGEAVSFDRWGAVVQIRLGDVGDSTVSAQDSVLVDVALPPNRAFGRRAIHCIGTATHVSATAGGVLWLVVRFSQLHIRQLEPGTLSVDPAAREGGDRDLVISEEKAGTSKSPAD